MTSKLHKIIVILLSYTKAQNTRDQDSLSLMELLHSPTKDELNSEKIPSYLPNVVGLKQSRIYPSNIGNALDYDNPMSKLLDVHD